MNAENLYFTIISQTGDTRARYSQSRIGQKKNPHWYPIFFQDIFFCQWVLLSRNKIIWSHINSYKNIIGKIDTMGGTPSRMPNKCVFCWAFQETSGCNGLDGGESCTVSCIATLDWSGFDPLVNGWDSKNVTQIITCVYMYIIINLY